jgi:integrase
MTAEMGRPKTAWMDLPPRMAARKLASGRVLYYYQARSKKIPLGDNLLAAKQEWARMESGAVGNAFPVIAKQYRQEVFPTLALGSRKHYDGALSNLEGAFGAFTLEQIEPQDVKRYMQQRTKKPAALYEKRILSALFSWARGAGITNVPNPCAGVTFSKAERRTLELKKRSRYVTDLEFLEVYERADEVIRDAMDLAVYTGQRPGDLLKAVRQDIKEGVLWVTQQKTGATVGIKVEDGLKRVLDRILGRKRPSMYLLANRHGQKIPYDTFNKRFAKARGAADWQFRDIRAKVATDSPSLKEAQLLLGHEDEQTTSANYRRKNGAAVSPLKRKV